MTAELTKPTDSDFRVEESIEAGEKDMFDDVFGEDAEKAESRKKLAEKANELKKQKEKKLEAKHNSNSDEPKDDKDTDEDDDGDEVEEDESSSVEPEIFGEVGAESETELAKKIVEEESEDEDDDDEF
jgi:hypothetical protein